MPEELWLDYIRPLPLDGHDQTKLAEGLKEHHSLHIRMLKYKGNTLIDYCPVGFCAINKIEPQTKSLPTTKPFPPIEPRH